MRQPEPLLSTEFEEDPYEQERRLLTINLANRLISESIDECKAAANQLDTELETTQSEIVRLCKRLKDLNHEVDALHERRLESVAKIHTRIQRWGLTPEDVQERLCELTEIRPRRANDFPAESNEDLGYLLSFSALRSRYYQSPSASNDQVAPQTDVPKLDNNTRLSSQENDRASEASAHDDEIRSTITVRDDSDPRSFTFTRRNSPIGEANYDVNPQERTPSADRPSMLRDRIERSVQSQFLSADEFAFIVTEWQEDIYVLRCPSSDCGSTPYLRDGRFLKNPFKSRRAFNHFLKHHSEIFGADPPTERIIFEKCSKRVIGLRLEDVVKRANFQNYQCDLDNYKPSKDKLKTRESCRIDSKSLPGRGIDDGHGAGVTPNISRSFKSSSLRDTPALTASERRYILYGGHKIDGGEDEEREEEEEEDDIQERLDSEYQPEDEEVLDAGYGHPTTHPPKTRQRFKYGHKRRTRTEDSLNAGRHGKGKHPQESNAAEHEELLVHWEQSENQDRENPMDWSIRRKWSNIGILAFLSLLTPLASSMLAPGVPLVLEEFQTNNNQIAAFVVPVFVLGFAFGPLVLAPLSELYGRNMIYHVCNTLFIIFTIACAFASSIGTLIAFRLLAGFAGVAVLTIGSGTIVALMPPAQRGKAEALWSKDLFSGQSSDWSVVGSWLISVLS
ncbi:putative Major facilitator superfamily domain-containing protein [Seiridium cardinale]